jgi:hypothetical protein
MKGAYTEIVLEDFLAQHVVATYTIEEITAIMDQGACESFSQAVTLALLSRTID